MAVPAINDRYTPTQKRLLSVLSDGERHDRRELLSCIGDPSYPVLQDTISKLRAKLPSGTIIVCEVYQGAYCYRWARRIDTRE